MKASMKKSSTDPATQTRNAGRKDVIMLRVLLTVLFALPLCLRALGCTVMIVAARQSGGTVGRPPNETFDIIEYGDL